MSEPDSAAHPEMSAAAHTGPVPSGDLEHFEAYWRAFGLGDSMILDMSLAMAHQFVGTITPGPKGNDSERGLGPAIYLGNHQTAYETLFLGAYLRALTGVPTLALARSEVRGRWLHEFIESVSRYPGAQFPEMVLYLNQRDPKQVFDTFTACRERLVRERLSIIVHVDGTRALRARQPVRQVSSALLDMAIAAGLPVVPFRVTGALPLEPVAQGLHVPIGYGAQDYYLGAPIEPAALSAMPYAQRREFVMQSINSLGPPLEEEQPCRPDVEFEAEVQAWMRRSGASHEYAILMIALQRLGKPCQETRRILDGAQGRPLELSPHAPGDRWLAAVAQRLLGPRAPIVKVDFTH